MGHEFAVYLDQNLAIDPIIQDSAVFARITRVLRLGTGDRMILFNNTGWWRVILGNISRSKITVQIHASGTHEPLAPKIVHIIPVLKREALEKALYNLTVLGVSQVYLVQTERAHLTHKNSEQLLSRLRAITIAAAEQSKQYILPVIHEPQKLTAEFLRNSIPPNIPVFLFDPVGENSIKIVSQYAQKKPATIVTITGPEAGFTSEEQALFAAHNAQLCALTPAILRAEDALLLGVGVIRIGI